ncbi:MAG: hydroxymethylglutaryl-CoA synthase [Chloroflexi bacterium]|nr:hydroxymethylglutaryl-CoA synthase [Chloroflexota bacterium]
MIGITSYGAYIPLWRVNLSEIGRARGEKAVSNFDEDSVTMAVAAAMDCLKDRDRSKVGSLYFATTTSPYVEKQAATIVAVAADLPREIFTADVTDSTKAGTTAIRMAYDAVKAGSAKEALVVASDKRLTSPRSDFEMNSGDGAAALLIGDTDIIASIEGSFSVTAEINDFWRVPGDSFLRAGEDRFALGEGYIKATRDAVSGLMKNHNLSLQDFSRVAIYAPDSRRHAELVRGLGFDEKKQVQDPLFGKVGCTWTAHSLMLLIAALEEAKPGDKILLAGYGNGGDAFYLQVTERIKDVKNRRGVKKHLESKRMVDYATYLRWRDLLPEVPSAVRPVKIPSTTALWREQREVLSFHGCRCMNCKNIQYPIQRVCTFCHAKDKYEEVQLSEKMATIFTYSMDYIAGTKDVPMVVTIVDFEGGGRTMLQMTDRIIEEIKVGMPLELSFRELSSVGGIHNYFWKTIPVRV